MTELSEAEAMLKRAMTRLADRRLHALINAAYYDGDHSIEFASPRFRKAFAWLLRARFADNWCRVVVDSKEERLRPEGFRIDGKVEAEAWRIWQANDMDAQSQMAHTEALIHGEAYATAWVSGDERTPMLTVESPLQALVIPNPQRPREALAGLRTFADEGGHDNAELFLPDSVWTFRTERPVSEYETVAARTWVQHGDTQDNPYKIVPMVILPNGPRLRPSTLIHASSELACVLPIQDALNKLVVDMIVASEYQSYRQRWVTGLELERDDEGNPTGKAPFGAGVDHLWQAEAENVKFGEFATVDLGQYTKAIDMLIVHLSSIASVPPHYLNASADRLSGESIKAAESGLVSKVRRKMIHFGDAWERLMRIAGMIAGHNAIAEAKSMEVVWRDPEIRTDATQADAVQKKKDIGVPWRQLMADLGYTPTQIEIMEQDRLSDALAAAFSTPALTAAPAPAGAP